LAGDYYGATCVQDGTQVRCWGYNGYGEVGNGTTNSPVLSPSLVTLMSSTTALDNVVDLHNGTATGSNYCALLSGRTLSCWGVLYQAYPSDFGVTNVVALGGTGTYIRYLTADGLYHESSSTNHVGVTRAPNCGPLH